VLEAHFNAGTHSHNNVADLTVSLWQQIRQLKEIMPASLQVKRINHTLKSPTASQHQHHRYCTLIPF